MQLFETLKSLLKINSISTDISTVNSFGDFLVELFTPIGFNFTKVKKSKGADFLIGETEIMDKSTPTIVLSAHMDTVFEADAFLVSEDENRIYGSGVSDMKASFVVLLEVLKNLKKRNLLKNIILSFSPEEELALPNHRDTIETIAKRGDYVLVFESTLNSQIEYAKDTRSIVVTRRGIEYYDLFIKGPGGHSGLATRREDRNNCILLLAQIILELEALADYDKVTTVNSGVIKGGQAFNVTAPDSYLSFEVRFQTNDEYQRVRAQIDKIIEKYNKTPFEIKLEPKIFFPAMQRNENQKFLTEIAFSVARELKINLLEEQRGAGSEASLFSFFNPSASVLDGFGAFGRGEHSKEEYVEKESVVSTISFVTGILEKLIK